MLRASFSAVFLAGALALSACGGNVVTMGTTGAGGASTSAGAATAAGGTATATSSAATTVTSSATTTAVTSSVATSVTAAAATVTSAVATTATSSAASSGGNCDPSTCGMMGFKCCGGSCVNSLNDINNCGTCGNVCTGSNPYCHMGACANALCGIMGCGAEKCCGNECCMGDQLCCDMYGPISTNLPACTAPVNGTCPAGCTACVCASPDTPIATPMGERRIADIAVGDLVYSVDHGAVVAVPVLRTNRTPVRDHQVVRVTLAGGAVLEVSALHPTADGRTFGDLRAGGTLDRIAITAVERIPYAHPFTYDILPASETHAYYAAGALIGTTLAP